MRLRTRRSDQQVEPREQDVYNVTVNGGYYIDNTAGESVVKPDGSLLFMADLDLRGDHLVSIHLTDEEFERLVEARLRNRPAEAFSAVGRAMAAATSRMRPKQTEDALESMGISRARASDRA